MEHDTLLSAHEKSLLRDFLVRRPKRLAAMNAFIGIVAVLLLVWMHPASVADIAVAGLSGCLVGVYFEQRHVQRLRGIFKKMTPAQITQDQR